MGQVVALGHTALFLRRSQISRIDGGLAVSSRHESKVRLSDHWGIHLFELPKFNMSVTELSSDIERWTYFLKHGQELDPATLPSTLASPAVRLATEVLEKMSHNTLERDQYEARQRFLRDQATNIAFAEERGEARGEARGQVKATRAMILQIGTKRLGAPPPEVVSQLNEIADLDHLIQLADQILDCPDWRSLLEGVSK